MGRARAELAAVAFDRDDAADWCSAILLRAIGHPALTLPQCATLSRELVLLSKAVAPDRLRLHDMLNTPPLVGHSDVDRVLAVLGSIPIDGNPALSTACGTSVRTIREVLKTHTGNGPAEWRCLSRGKRFVGLLVNTRNNIGQCADAAAYRYGRQSVAECRRLFGRIPTEIRRLLDL